MFPWRSTILMMRPDHSSDSPSVSVFNVDCSLIIQLVHYIGRLTMLYLTITFQIRYRLSVEAISITKQDEKHEGTMSTFHKSPHCNRRLDGRTTIGKIRPSASSSFPLAGVVSVQYQYHIDRIHVRRHGVSILSYYDGLS